MLEKRVMLLRTDQLRLARYRAGIVVMLDLSGAGVFPELEVGFHMSPDEAIHFAQQLLKEAAAMKGGSPST